MDTRVFTRKHIRLAGFVLVVVFFLWQWFLVDGGLFGSPLFQLRANPGDQARVARLADLTNQMVANPALADIGLELVAEEQTVGGVTDDLLTQSRNSVARTYRTTGDPAELAPRVIETFDAEGWSLGETNCHPEFRSGGESKQVRAHTSVSFTASRSVDDWHAGGRIRIVSTMPVAAGEPLYKPGEEVDLEVRIDLFNDPITRRVITTSLTSVYSGEPCSDTTCPDIDSVTCLNTAIWRGNLGMTAIAVRLGCPTQPLTKATILDTGQDPARLLRQSEPEIARIQPDSSSGPGSPSIWLGFDDEGGLVAHMDLEADDSGTYRIYTCRDR